MTKEARVTVGCHPVIRVEVGVVVIDGIGSSSAGTKINLFTRLA